MRNKRWLVLLMVVGYLASGCVFLQRASVTSAGGGVFGPSTVTDVSNDGRFVVFESAEQFDAGDTANYVDVFLRDTLLATTTRVSARADSGPGNGDSYDGKVSNNGSVVAFTTDATNLGLQILFSDSNNQPDIAVRDLNSATPWAFYFTTILCGDFCGATANGASTHPDVTADGSTVVFESTATNLVTGDTNGVSDIFRQRADATTPVAIVSLTDNDLPTNGGSYNASAGYNSCCVVFSSDATNIPAGGDNNGFRDIYMRKASDTTLLSVDANGFATNGDSDHPTTQGFAFQVSYESDATDIVSGDSNGLRDVFLWQTGQPNVRMSVDDAGNQITTGSGMSNLGLGFNPLRVLWDDGSNHLFVRDLDNARTDNASADPDGGLATATAGALAQNDPYVAFSSVEALNPADSNGATDVYLRWFINPEVMAVSSSVVAGTTTNVTITGERLSFVSGFLASSGQTWTNLVVVDDNTVTADVTIAAGTNPGIQWVNLTTADGGPGPNSGAFTNCQCLTVTN